MADLAELTERLERLREARGSPESEVSYDGEAVKFRSDHELMMAIRDLERQIANLARPPVRRIVVGTSKGF